MNAWTFWLVDVGSERATLDESWVVALNADRVEDSKTEHVHANKNRIPVHVLASGKSVAPRMAITKYWVGAHSHA